MIAALHLCNGDKKPVGLLHVLISKTHLAAEVRATHLEPDQVIRVVHNPHLVGFSVSDSYGSLAPDSLLSHDRDHFMDG